MKAIKVELKNAGKIAEAIEGVMGRASRHAADFKWVLEQAARAERELFALVCRKADMAGATAVAISGERVAGKYRYPREATRVTLARKGSGWYLTGIERTSIGCDGGFDARLMLSAAQDARAVAVVRACYTVAVEETPNCWVRFATWGDAVNAMRSTGSVSARIGTLGEDHYTVQIPMVGGLATLCADGTFRL